MAKQLADFLDNSENSVSREVMLSHRVSYELKVGSALANFDLRVYRPDVDRDGFDMLLEQRSLTRPLQLKSRRKGASTGSWKVRSHLLHPSRIRSGYLHFALPRIGLGDGLDGALLVVEFTVAGDSLSIEYLYFDLAVAAAHTLGITAAPQRTVDSATQLLSTLRRLDGNGSVTIGAGMALRVPTAEGVLALLGFRTRFRGSFWYETLRAYALKNRFDAGDEKRPIPELISLASDALAEIQSGVPRKAV